MSPVPTAWPNSFPALPALNLLYYLISLTVISTLLRGRISKGMSLVQWSIVALLSFVWLFLFFATMVLFGTGTSRIERKTGIEVTCITTVWGAVLLYGASKLCVLSFLAERVYLVHSYSAKSGKLKRFQSNWYKVSVGCIFVWLIVGITDITGKIGFLDENGGCIIGIKPYASISLLIIDFLVNVFLTTAFSLPIYSSPSLPLRRLAQKSILASFVCFCSTTINMVIMTTMSGEQSSYLNLFSSSCDVLINALVIHIITKSDLKTRKNSFLENSGSGLGNIGAGAALGGDRAGRRISGYPGVLIGTESVRVEEGFSPKRITQLELAEDIDEESLEKKSAGSSSTSGGI